MTAFIVLALIIAAFYFIRKYLKAEASSLEAEFEQDKQAVEAAVQTDAAVAQKVAEGVVNEIKAKL